MNQTTKMQDKAAKLPDKPAKSEHMNQTTKMPDKAVEPPAKCVKTWPRMEDKYLRSRQICSK